MKTKFGLRITAFVLALLTSCVPRENASVDYYDSDLFHDVQMAAIFPDSKTFADCTPKIPIDELINKYEQEKVRAGFSLSEFVNTNFDLPVRPTSNFTSEQNVTVDEHITRLWPVLTRDRDSYNPRSSLLPLPMEYIVPGGRFSEIYYWDSYFTMVGLNEHGRVDMIQNMVENFAFLIDSIGHIPNGNRNYYVTRSQPPFFALMVKLLDQNDSSALETYLPSLQKEYNFWMTGADKLSKPGEANLRVVMLPNGTIVNRYWDNKAIPRPEAHKEDYNLKIKTGRDGDDIYRNLKAAAESGWDFSTRWFDKNGGLETIHTTDIAPCDLNALMYNLEKSLAEGYARIGDNANNEKFLKLLETRKEAILSFMWDSEAKFFIDYNFVTGNLTGVKSLAGMYPLFFSIPPRAMAEQASNTLRAEFLKPGGLVTTLTESGEQWDAPNGWAPLQWMAYVGLKNYGQNDLAMEARNRWVHLDTKIFHRTGKMLEKYNVMDTTLAAGGGEYPNQDGFGWTNGVWLGMTYDEVLTTSKAK